MYRFPLSKIWVPIWVLFDNCLSEKPVESRFLKSICVPWGRRFKSCCPDTKSTVFTVLFCFVLHFMLHECLFEIYVCFFIHVALFLNHSVPVYAFQYGIVFPAATLHNIGVRDAKSVLDTCGIMAQIVEAEVLDIQFLQHPCETVSDSHGI